MAPKKASKTASKKRKEIESDEDNQQDTVEYEDSKPSGSSSDYSSKKASKRSSISVEKIPIPPSCEVLCRIFSCIDSLVSVMSIRKIPCHFETIKPAVEKSLGGSSFTGSHLAQIKYLVPEIVYYKLEPVETPDLKSELRLSIEFHRAIGKGGRGSKSISVETATKEVAQRSIIFRQKVVNYVEPHHKAFLQSLSPEGRIYPESLYWHPMFDLAQVPPIPEQEIPRPPSETLFSTLDSEIPLDKPGTTYAPLGVSEMVEYIRQHAYYAHQITHVRVIEPREAVYADTRKPISTYVMEALNKVGVKRLYKHQVDAIDAVYDGYKCVVISASTSSGKSMIYNIPALQAIESDFAARSIYLFPTKALAQDQLRVLQGYFPYAESTFATYDGDTEQKHRIMLRADARVILTNPDMLHVGMLPNHRLWADCLKNLKYIVIDELHSYRGIFGSHVAQIIRRLRRLCRFYGSEPQFILCSATISNPIQHASRLTGIGCYESLADHDSGKDIILIDEDGSPRGQRTMVLWNPPLLNEEKNQRRSSHIEATHLFVELLKHNFRTIAFCKTKNVTELLLSYSKDRLKIEKKDIVNLIRSYRAGYTPEIRRQIEKDLFHGKLLGVAATNALELGVDIGSLDATVSVGYPGSIASVWQQVGRCGRGTRDSLSFIVAYETPLDQHFIRNPQDLFSRPHEYVVIDPDNQAILEKHLCCSAKELPLSEQDFEYYGDVLVPVAEDLLKKKVFAQMQETFIYTKDDFPSQLFGIRSAGTKRYRVIVESTGEVLEEVEEGMAFLRIYPGGILLNQGETYEVMTLNQDALIAKVRPVRVNYYTKPRDITTVMPVDTIKTMMFLDHHKISQGRVDVKLSVLGYSKIYDISGKAYERFDLDLPSTRFKTKGVWIDIASFVEAAIHTLPRRPSGVPFKFQEGVHAIAHVLESIIPLYVITDSWDIHVVCPKEDGVGEALYSKSHRIIIYDGCEGGAGISERIFEVAGDLLQAAYSVLIDCMCQSGCPSCVQSPKCTNYNTDLDKESALAILQVILAAKESTQIHSASEPESGQKAHMEEENA